MNFMMPADTDRPMRRAPSLRQVAEEDPRIAIAVLGGCSPDGELYHEDRLSDWNWQWCGPLYTTFQLRGCFNSGAACQTVPGEYSNLCESDLWIRRIAYTVRQPNAWRGSVFGPQARLANRLQPDIDVTLGIRNRFWIAGQPTPLETLPEFFECACPVGLILSCGICLNATFTNLRALLCDDPTSTDPCCAGEVPTDVAIVFHAMRLPVPYGACGMPLALKALRRYGLLPDGFAPRGVLPDGA